MKWFLFLDWLKRNPPENCIFVLKSWNILNYCAKAKCCIQINNNKKRIFIMQMKNWQIKDKFRCVEIPRKYTQFPLLFSLIFKFLLFFKLWISKSNAQKNFSERKNAVFFGICSFGNYVISFFFTMRLYCKKGNFGISFLVICSFLQVQTASKRILSRRTMQNNKIVSKSCDSIRGPNLWFLAGFSVVECWTRRVIESILNSHTTIGLLQKVGITLDHHQVYIN